MAQSKQSYFYVLFCKDGSLYGGYTTELDRRLKEHNDGIGAKYTRMKSKRPVNMIYAEAYYTRSGATKAEAAFKKLTRKAKEAYLEKQGVGFPLNEQKECLVVEMEKPLTRYSCKDGGACG